MKTPKALLTTLLSTTLAFAPISVSANTIATPTPNTISFPMPNTKDVAKKITKVGRTNAVAFAVGRLFDGIDWVMDPANNSIQYKQKQTDGKKCNASAYDWTTKELVSLTGTNQEVATAWCKYSRPYHNPPEGMRQISNYQYHSSCKAGEAGVIISCELPTVYVPLEQIAEQIIKNALQGHPESVKFLREIAEEHKAKPSAPTQLDWGLSFKPTKPVNPPLNPPMAIPKPENPTREPEQPKQCKPCQPYPVGVIGYQGPKISVHGIDGTRNGTGRLHYIIFQVQQNPKTCQCRWQETKKIVWSSLLRHSTVWLG